MTAAVQTVWAELIAATLADAGVVTCVISPGSRSAPLVAALAGESRFDLPVIIDERAAAFFALGVARATGVPAAVVCTSGSAAAHYLPAIVEASAAAVPLVVITADRPPELQQCGASQTIDQIGLYGGFVREAFDLGAPVASEPALRALRRKIVQAVTRARGPHPGPVHLEVPLRKPLEPTAPQTDAEHALARAAAALRGPIATRPPRLVADRDAMAALAAAIASEPHGLIVAGAMPLGFAGAREAVFELAARAGYPVIAEAGSQLRGGAVPPGVHPLDFGDLIFGSPGLAGAPAPKLIVQLGAEPVAAGWSAAQPALAGAARWVLAEHAWHDADSSARAVIVGEVAETLRELASRTEPRPDRARSAGHAGSRTFADAWHAADARAADAAARAPADGEVAVVRAILDATPPTALIQLGNSLPIRTIDLLAAPHARAVITQRGAAGIDGHLASAAGATRAGKPVLLVVGDVGFAHDLGALLAAREAGAPLAIVVIDNAGGQIFGSLPIARAASAELLARYFTTAPNVDPAAVASALGLRAVTATTPAAAATAVAAALTTPGPTVIHAPVASTSARDFRRAALELLAANPGARHG